MVSSVLSRRTLLQLAGAASLPLSSGLLGTQAKAAAGTLTIAYNVNLPSWDPTRRPVGGQSDHPGDLSVGVRSIHRPERRTCRSPPAC